MKLSEYLEDVMPTLLPDMPKSTRCSYRKAVSKLTKWLGKEIELQDVSVSLIDRFRVDHPALAGRIRGIMATHDPVKFRQRKPERPKAKSALPSEAGIYLENVYAKKYEPLALRSRRPNSKRLYRTTLKMFDKYLERAATLDDLSDETVSAFASWRLDSGLSKSSVNKDLSNLLALWRWCFRKQLVDRWPDVALEVPAKAQPLAWTEDEMKKLYLTATNLEGKLGKLSASHWWCALLLVAWNSGERINAIINLKWENVDLKRKWIRFEAEDRKGAREDSAVQLSDDAVAALQRIKADVGPVFPWPYNYTYLWREFGKLLRLAGLSSDAKSKFHRIRKTVASYAEAAGGNATAMLRHSKREVTEAYLDPRIVKQQQPADVLFRLGE